MVIYTKSFRDRIDFPIRLKSTDGDTWDSVALSQATSQSTGDVEALNLSDITISGTLLTQWIAGGSAGATYLVDLLLVTTLGRRKHLQFQIKVY